MPSLKLLVVDGNTRETNQAHVDCGGRLTGEHYAEVLRSIRPDVECVIVHPADPGGAELPPGIALHDFDGVAWTGSALNIYKDDPAIPPQIELARSAFQAGVPQFGSCWGLQVTTVAAGGTVRPNPKGRELGFARRITLTEAGRTHPMFQGRRNPFDAIAVHMDEVETAPPGTVVLAANDMSAIQAAEFHCGKGVCWAVQYHPEYDFNEIATVILRYGSRLVEAGFFANTLALERFVRDLRALDADPGRRDLAWLYGLDEEVLDRRQRHTELRHWLDGQVARRAAARGRG